MKLDFYIVGIAYPTLSENGARYQTRRRSASKIYKKHSPSLSFLFTVTGSLGFETHFFDKELGSMLMSLLIRYKLATINLIFPRRKIYSADFR